MPADVSSPETAVSGDAGAPERGTFAPLWESTILNNLLCALEAPGPLPPWLRRRAERKRRASFPAVGQERLNPMKDCATIKHFAARSLHD